MKLGVFTALFSNKSFEEMLDAVEAAGLDTVEIGTGAYPGNPHCPIDELLESEEKRKQYIDAIHSRGLRISAFSCHGNAITPDQKFAAESHNAFVKSVKLASLLNVPVVNCFSGTPGDHEEAKYPNWPVVPWPTEYNDVLQWQWEQKLVPYWKKWGAFAEEHNVKIGIELHGGFLVHSPYTMLKLRELTCSAVGANFDPSHMWWQGIDPVAAIKILGKEQAIHHFHAKDIYLDQDNMNMYGLTDMQPYSSMQTRAWNFRTIGYGHGLEVWNNIISALKLYGYDYAISIEHEDGLMSVDEGFNKAVENLKPIIIREQAGGMWWA